jgi:hypothetical protein
MGNTHRVLYKAVALLVSVGMLNLCLLSSLSTASASTASEVGSARLMVGRLAVAEQQSIFVNGNIAGAGTTIFSGMRLQTPEGVNASVQLGSLGYLTIEPNSDLTLDFSNSSVEVRVASGDAALTTNEKVAGTLTAADGKVLRSENSKSGTLATKTAARRMSGKQRAAAIIIPIVAAIIIIAIVVADDDDESPNNP